MTPEQQLKDKLNPFSVKCACGHRNLVHGSNGCNDCFCSGFRLRHTVGCICSACRRRRERVS